MTRENPDQIYDVHSAEILEKRRSCTDIICLLLFIGFIVVYCWMIYNQRVKIYVNTAGNSGGF